MSYNNNNRNNGGRRDYNNGSRSGGNGGERSRNKHSGADSGNASNGKFYVRGWNYSKANGLVTFYCTPYEKTKKVKSTKGKNIGTTYANFVCVVQRKFHDDVLVSCFYNENKGIITIPSYGMVINPAAPNGGYCGTFSGK